MNGIRYRILLEWYNPRQLETEHVKFLDTRRELEAKYPEATVIAYVEPNPPADEVGAES